MPVGLDDSGWSSRSRSFSALVLDGDPGVAVLGLELALAGVPFGFFPSVLLWPPPAGPRRPVFFFLLLLEREPLPSDFRGLPVPLPMMEGERGDGSWASDEVQGGCQQVAKRLQRMWQENLSWAGQRFTVVRATAGDATPHERVGGESIALGGETPVAWVASTRGWRSGWQRLTGHARDAAPLQPERRLEGRGKANAQQIKHDKYEGYTISSLACLSLSHALGTCVGAFARVVAVFFLPVGCALVCIPRLATPSGIAS